MVVPEAHISSSKVSNKSIVEEDVQKEVRVCDRKGFAERSCSVCNTKKAAAAQEELVNAIPREREREYSSRAAKKRTRWMCLKPVNTSVFSSSQPIPPAPTISTFSFCSPLNKQEHAHACTKPLRRRVWACFATPRERTPTWRRPQWWWWVVMEKNKKHTSIIFLAPENHCKKPLDPTKPQTPKQKQQQQQQQEEKKEQNRTEQKQRGTIEIPR